MANRLAACLSLIVFDLCLYLGIRADNTFTTTVTRALIAMGGTFVVGLIVGAVAQRMVDENVQAQEARLKDSSSAPPEDR